MKDVYLSEQQLDRIKQIISNSTDEIKILNELRNNLVRQSMFHRDFGTQNINDLALESNELPSKNIKNAKVRDFKPVDYLNDELFISSFKKAELETKQRIKSDPEYFRQYQGVFTLKINEEPLKRVIGDFTTRLRRYLVTHKDKNKFTFLYSVENWLDAFRKPNKSMYFNSNEIETIKMLDILQNFTQTDNLSEIADIRKDLNDLEKISSAFSVIDTALERPVNNIEKIMENLECQTEIIKVK